MGVAVVAALGAAMAIGVGGLVLGPRVVRVSSRSMAPTIESGGYVLLRTAVGTIERGDVVAFRNPAVPGRSHVFRVIVLPGERFASSAASCTSTARRSTSRTSPQRTA